MTRYLLIFGLLLLAGAPVARGAADERRGRPDHLRDGSVVRGLVIPTTGPRGRSSSWCGGTGPSGTSRTTWRSGIARPRRRRGRRSSSDRRGWRAGGRSASEAEGVGPDDRILRWIDGEQRRLADPERAARTPLVIVRLPRAEIRELDRRAGRRRPAAPPGVGRRGPRARDHETVAELTDALEGAGSPSDPNEPEPARGPRSPPAAHARVRRDLAGPPRRDRDRDRFRAPVPPIPGHGDARHRAPASSRSRASTPSTALSRAEADARPGRRPGPGPARPAGREAPGGRRARPHRGRGDAAGDRHPT